MKVKPIRAFAIYNEDNELTFIYAPGKYEHGRLSIFASKEAAKKSPNSIDGIVEVSIVPIPSKSKSKRRGK